MISEKYLIRLAHSGDEQAIHDAHMRSIRELCTKEYTKEQIDAWSGRAFNFEIRSKSIRDDFVLVVETAKGIMGYGHLKWWPEKQHVEVMALYLVSEVKGLGAGKEMLRQMMIKAQELGFSKLHLSSTKTSINFYLANGFYIVGEEINVEIGGVKIPAIGMEKLLPAI